MIDEQWLEDQTVTRIEFDAETPFLKRFHVFSRLTELGIDIARLRRRIEADKHHEREGRLSAGAVRAQELELDAAIAKFRAVVAGVQAKP